MISDALGFLATQAEKASVPFIATTPAEPAHIYYVNGVRTVAEPHPRQHVAADLSAVINFANLNPVASVWYSMAGVVCLLDDKVRRDMVELNLHGSPQLKEIASWGSRSKPFKQRELILLLRTMFKRCLVQAPNLIESLRVVRFSNSNITDTAVSTGKASIGKRIESEVSGASGIPEEFYLNVPMFAAPFDNVEGLIDVAVEMDSVGEAFTLHPVPGTVAKQIALAEAAIGAKLREAIENGEGRVFYGSPNVSEAAAK